MHAIYTAFASNECGPLGTKSCVHSVLIQSHVLVALTIGIYNKLAHWIFTGLFHSQHFVMRACIRIRTHMWMLLTTRFRSSNDPIFFSRMIGEHCSNKKCCDYYTVINRLNDVFNMLLRLASPKRQENVQFFVCVNVYPMRYDWDYDKRSQWMWYVRNHHLDHPSF
jgi:hypothetical protein